MRETKQKGRTHLVPVFLAAAAVFGLALVLWPDAFATNRRVEDLVAEVTTKPARHRKLMALTQLCRLRSRAAREAVIELADGDDEMTALCAISTMSREDLAGFRDALEAIVDDGDRSEVVRCAALGACLKLRKDDDRSWNSIKDWVAARTSGDDELHGFAHAYAKSRWGEEVSDDE